MLEDDPATPSVDERTTADTSAVNIYNYAISRGTCDQFAGAGEAGISGADADEIQAIRDNYGFDCNGVRMPATARTLYSLNGKLNYTYGTGSRMSLSLAQSRFHGHSAQFPLSYINTLSTGMLRGFSNRNRLATLNWTQNLSKSAERALALDVALSYQQDRTINSPLTIDSDLSTRDPFGGFIMKAHGVRLQLRQLPGHPGADRQHPAEPGPDHADRREQRQQLPHGRRAPEQRLRPVRQLSELRQQPRRQHLGDGRGRPVHHR